MKRMKNIAISTVIVSVIGIGTILMPKGLKADELPDPFLCVYNYVDCAIVDGYPLKGDKYEI